MKVFTVEKVRLADEYTIQNEPIASIDLMERASSKVASYLLTNYSKKHRLFFICGKGNNGGDGLAVARMMIQYGYKCSVYLAMGEEGSNDFNVNLKRLKKLDGLEIIADDKKLIELINNSKFSLCIDALFGSGLSRPVQGDLGELIRQLNICQAQRVSIDIPSGLYADQATDPDHSVVRADLTLGMQFPKLSFLMPENERYLKGWEVLDIGIHKDFIANEESDLSFITERNTVELSTFAHKGSRGRVFVLAGGYGRMGAALMVAKASIKAGAGLVTVHSCKHCVEIVQGYLPEALISIDYNEYELGEYPDLEKQNAIVIGPAIGFAGKTESLFKQVLSEFEGKIVIDADALTMLARNQSLWDYVPKNAILTPHIGEFDRLFGEHKDHFERLKTMKGQAKKHQVFLVLKGKYTAVCSPEGQISFNSTGNNGLAKGGSGDILAGMIASYLCLFQETIEAIRSAVYDHGLAADISVKHQSKNSLLPTDLLENLHRIEKK